MQRSRDPHAPPEPPIWQRDLFHVLLGSACGLLIGLTFYRLAPRSGGPATERFRRVESFVEEAFVRTVDEEQLVDEALRGMLSSLDPYSRYYTRDELSDMERETSGRFRGIGVVFARPTQEARVLFAMPGSPADRAGIGVGDRFLEVDGVEVSALEPGGLHEMLTEREDALVEILVAPLDGPERLVELERTELVDPTVRHAQMLDTERGLGYLAIRSFSLETPAEFDAAMTELQRAGMTGLILDVRGNLGGVLRSAVTLVNRFVPEGLIVSQEGRGDPVLHEAAASEAWHADLPLVVLIDGLSASASEVFAAALQEHRAAVVVGSPSYGKGVVQEVRTLKGQGAVKLTTAYYYTPSHRNLERTVEDAWDTALLPDLEVHLTELEERRLHRQLASYSPPPEARERIRAWEAEEGRELYPRPASGAQLEAALALLRGERPGAYSTVAETP